VCVQGEGERDSLLYFKGRSLQVREGERENERERGRALSAIVRSGPLWGHSWGIFAHCMAPFNMCVSIVLTWRSITSIYVQDLVAYSMLMPSYHMDSTERASGKVEVRVQYGFIFCQLPCVSFQHVRARVRCVILSFLVRGWRLRCRDTPLLSYT
jgi:hypothetical protein